MGRCSHRQGMAAGQGRECVQKGGPLVSEISGGDEVWLTSAPSVLCTGPGI